MNQTLVLSLILLQEELLQLRLMLDNLAAATVLLRIAEVFLLAKKILRPGAMGSL